MYKKYRFKKKDFDYQKDAVLKCETLTHFKTLIYSLL